MHKQATTKDQLLRLLENSRDAHLSGEKLASSLGVSRNSIWKAVEALRGEGYRIDAITNKGYRLSQENDLLSPASIEHFLPDQNPFSLIVRKCVSSTNIEARQQASEGAPEGTVVAAEAQTAGRGRRGKAFFSPASTGIYVSVVLRPSLQVHRIQYLTCAAAVATSQAIEAVTKKHAHIKWVNDIFCDGRKVAGILTEGAVDMESGYFDYAVLGIGVNVLPPETGFPDEIAPVAGSVATVEDGPLRSKLIAEILTRFWALYEHFDSQTFYEEYRRRCFIIGQPLVLTRQGARIRVRAIDLTKDFQLVVELPDKTREYLSYGEINADQSP